jgi:hypothetical protein
MANHFSVAASSFSKSLNLEELNFSFEADVSFRIEKGVRFMNMKHLLMCDWDVAHNGVVDDHHTVASIQEVDEIMKRWVAAHPDQFWVGYKTPSGGAHAFLISKKVDVVGEDIAILDLLKVDKLYQYFCEKRKSFAVRISPKPNRFGDYIASYWKTWGTGQPIEELEEVLRKHDSFLKPNNRYYKNL